MQTDEREVATPSNPSGLARVDSIGGPQKVPIRMEFAPEEKPSFAPWKVLIVDDEPEVHNVTRLVLGNFRFDNRRLQFLSAHSAAEARELLEIHHDAAVVLLDVVMESEQAGLQLVRSIREELGNPFV